MENQRGVPNIWCVRSRRTAGDELTAGTSDDQLRNGLRTWAVPMGGSTHVRRRRGIRLFLISTVTAQERYRWRLLGLLNADQVYSKAARPDTCPLFASGSFRTRGLKVKTAAAFHVEDRSLAYQGRRLRSQPHVRFDIVGEGTDEVFFGLDVASKSSRWRLMDDDQEILRIRYDDKLLLLGAHAQQLQFVLQQHPTVSPSSLRLTSTPAICSL